MLASFFNWFSSHPSKATQQSLHPFYDAPYVHNQSTISLTQRINELEHRINQIFQSMGGTRAVQVRFYPDLFPLSVPSADKNAITFPLLPLIGPDEFPSHLQVKGPDDPKLDDPEYFEQMADWIAQVFQVSRTPVRWEDQQAFKLYLRFMENPEMAKRALNFIIHHELAHILHGHCDKPHTDTTGFSYKFKLLLSAFAIWIYEPFGTWIDQMTNSMETKKIEKEADQTAVHFTKDVEGPTYLFQTIRQQNRQSRRDPHAPALAKLFLSASGDFIPHLLSHQLESNRIDSLHQK